MRMKAQLKKLPLLRVLLFSFLLAGYSDAFCQNTSYFDGPYIFDLQDSLRVQWIEAGVPLDTLIAKKDAGLFKRDSLPLVNLQDLQFDSDQDVTYSDVDKVIAVSDVHGKYDILVKLLISQGVINKQLQWTFGKNHLVVIGDNFDRGEKVLDILWFLFYLQKKADAAGGKVHMLLGNHEIMVLKGDLRYLNKKYLYTSAAFTTPYQHFFKEGSVLGDWLATHKIMISIDKRLFVHAGISPKFLVLDYSMKKINRMFQKYIIRGSEEKIKNNRELAFLVNGEGPIWYRGYFDEGELNQDSITMILQKLGQKNIIVGHTSMTEINPFFERKIIGIDNSIKCGDKGQALIIENDDFFTGDQEGNISRLKLTSVKKPSVFEYIYKLDYVPTLEITTDIKQLLKRSETEEYQVAEFRLLNKSNEPLLDIPARLRARGNKRKMVCRYPPIKVDFKKSLLDSLGFLSNDKIKLVLPCGPEKTQQEFLFKEYFLYDLYAMIDSNTLKTKMININLKENGEKDRMLIGFLIEDEKEYARRKNAKILDKAKINAQHLDRESFVKMEFFQYMISNTDWSLRNRHNLELIKLDSMERVTAIAYDFDYSGFVGQDYAVPHESLPIDNIHERYFFSYPISEGEFRAAASYFLSIEQQVYQLCDEATYMKPKTIEDNKAYLESFFRLLRNPKRLYKEMIR